MTNKDKCFLAYLAGLIDGEGYIGITRNINWMEHRYWSPNIGICMTDAISLLIISATFPEFRFSIKKKKDDRKQVFRAEIHNTNDCYKILKLVQPFLFVKWEQAKIMLSYLSWRRQNLWLTNGINWLNDEDRNKRNKLLEKYHEKSQKYYDLLRAKKQEPINGVNSVNLLKRMSLREYRAKREDCERLLEGVETRLNKYKTTSAPEQNIVHKS